MTHRIHRALTSLLASTVLLSFAHLAAADCASDLDCKAGRVCRDRQCTSLSCATDRDCPDELVCTSSRCTADPAVAPEVPPPTAPPPPAPVPTPPPAPPTQAAGNQGTAQALSGMESLVLDCSTAPDDPRCRGQKGVVLSETYIFPPPRRTFVQFSIHGSYSHGFVKGANIFGGGMDIGASLAHGLVGPLPGPAGGWFNAIVVEALTGIYGGGLVTTGSPTYAAGMVSLRPQVRIGVELDHFAAFDRESRMQSGLGVNAMYSVGGDWQNLMGDFEGSELFAGHGPSIALMLGEYHPLSSKLMRGFLRAGLWHVPAADTLFVNFGGGVSVP